MARLFRACQIGIFQDVSKQRFSAGMYAGTFRVFRGLGGLSCQLEYIGPESFSDDEICIISEATGKILKLEPLALYTSSSDQDSKKHIYFCDKMTKESFSFKSALAKRSWTCTKENHADLYGAISNLRSNDFFQNIVTGAAFNNVSE